MPIVGRQGAPVEASPCNGTALRKATRRVSQLYDAMLAPSEGSCPASAVIETTTPSATHQGATALHAQPNRERPIHNSREV